MTLRRRWRSVVASLRRRLDPLPEPAGDRGAEADDDGPDAAGGENEDAARPALETAAERVRYAPDSADFGTVIEALEAAEPERRRLAAEALAAVPESSRRRAVGAVPPLVRLLDDDGLGTRRNAAKALARLAPTDRDAIVAAAPELVEHLDAHNLRIGNDVTAALREAARSAPDEVAPLLFTYVDADVTVSTRLNALAVLEEAARADPAAVAPVVPDLVARLERRLTDRDRIVRTLAPIAAAEPALVAPAVDELVAYAEDDRDGGSDAVIEALAGLALADPTEARPAVPALTAHLTEESPAYGRLAARALVQLAERCPGERERVLDVLAGADHGDRFRAALALAETGEAVGEELADAALEGSPFRPLLDR